MTVGHAPLAIDRLPDVRTTNTMNISLCIYKQGLWNMLHIALELGLALIQYAVATFTPSRKNSWSAIFTKMI